MRTLSPAATSPTAPDWGQKDYTRVPYRLYHDPEVFQAEQRNIFRGPTWNYVALEAELPQAGDFRTTWVGDTPVIVSRDAAGAIHVVVNRCAHRGALVQREARGRAESHICIYHKWSYALDGALQGVPFRRGLKGKGGLPPEFRNDAHGLQPLRVARYAGLVFASFSEAAEPLEAYLGPVFTRHMDRLFRDRKVKLLGYQRQRIGGNWKFYLENTRDTYHGSLLHEFQSTFGTSRITQTGGVIMDARHRHNLTWSKIGTDDNAEFSRLYRENKVHESALRLRAPEFVDFQNEFGDGISLAICSIFPNLTIHQISNSLGVRQVRPLSQDEFELVFTLVGYEDDAEPLARHRLLQANFVGPAGLISMEDGEAIEIAHRASRADQDADSVVEMGGGGPIPDSVDHRVHDIPCRGMWSYYAELMGLEPEGAVR